MFLALDLVYELSACEPYPQLYNMQRSKFKLKMNLTASFTFCLSCEVKGLADFSLTLNFGFSMVPMEIKLTKTRLLLILRI